jgi:hypothetical protein
MHIRRDRGAELRIELVEPSLSEAPYGTITETIKSCQDSEDGNAASSAAGTKLRRTTSVSVKEK